MKAALLVNLGSPKSTETKDVKKYLDEFLMDERVIDLPYWRRFLLVKGIILNTRPKKSAAAYRKVWTDEGSPLIFLSERLQAKVQEKSTLEIGLAMRYAEPSIKSEIQKLHDKGVTEIFLVPLYPHYAMSSYETVVVKTQEVIKEFFPNIKLETLDVFYNQPEYIKVLGDSIKEYNVEEYDKILFSYHGLPERHILKGDVTKSHCKMDKSCCATKSEAHNFCYRHQCYEMTKLIKEYLNIPEEKIMVSFQSRLGRDPWIKPYTDQTLEELPAEGAKKLLVVTPAFVSDCLETIEEIGMEGKEEFLAAGGTKFERIPCLNDRQEWADLLTKWIKEWEEK